MDTPRRLRVFVDANILIRGISFPRYPYEILRLAARHTIVLAVSPSVLADARHYLRLLFPISCTSCSRGRSIRSVD